MDDRHFDRLTRLLATPESRRRMLGSLAALPVVGGLLDVLDPDEVGARRRGRRRKTQHQHGKGRRRKRHKRKCRAEPIAQTCNAECGSVLNNCKKMVDCGSCAAGLVCAAGRCIPGPGTCAAGANSCNNPGGAIGCNAPAMCQCQSTAEGQTACVSSFGLPGSGCGSCASSADCVALFPDIPGVVCGVGPLCCGGVGGYCLAPSPAT